MKPKQRRDAIVHLLHIQGKTSIEALARHLSTTSATIRKDLILLEREGTVFRLYGGVVLACKQSDPPITSKAQINTARKKSIARKAVTFINDGDSLIIDSGSTVLQMVPYLTQFKCITVMTNSLLLLNQLVRLGTDQTILMPGGTFRKKSASFHGSLAENAISQCSFDKLFIGADGIDLVAGVTTYNELHEVSRAMCHAARKRIVLVDSSKFGRRSPNRVCSLDDIDILITDNKLPISTLRELQGRGLNVILVSCDADDNKQQDTTAII